MLFIATVAGHLVLAGRMVGPIIQMDEEGYLGQANLFGHGSGYLLQRSPYQPGFGLLLAPVASLTTSHDALYRGALVANALALGGLVVAAYLLARRFLGPSAGAVCFAVAALVGVYPTYIGWGDVVTSASVFVAACAFTAVAVGWAAAAHRPCRWIVPGLLAGASYCLHPVGTAVMVGVLIAAGLRPGRASDRAGAATAGLIGMLPMVAVSIVAVDRVVAYSRTELLRRGVARAVAAGVVPKVVPKADSLANSYGHLHLSQLQNFVYEAAGQSWYLTVATAGLAVVGFGAALRSGWRLVRGRTSAPGDVLAGFALVIFVVGMATSTQHWNLSAAGGGQGDMLIYGRFNEQLLVPLLVLGLCEVFRLRRRRPAVAAGWAGLLLAAVGIFGVLLHTGRSAAALRAPIVSYNVLALQPAIHARGTIDVLWLSVAAGAAGVLVVFLGREAGAWIAAPLLGAAWLMSGLSGSASLTRDAHARAEQRVVLHALDLVDRTVGPTRCVGYDLNTENEWTISTDQVFRPAMVMHRFDSRAGEVPCSDLVLTTRLDLAQTYPGARIMAGENFTGMRLWVLAGRIQGPLDRAGLLLPPGFPAPLPATAVASQLAVLGASHRVVAAGESVAVSLWVHHVGTGAPWPTRYGLAGTQHGWVALAVGWERAETPPRPVADVLARAARRDLSVPLWPGESLVESLRIPTTDADGSVLTPGRYRLTVGLVQEAVGFFSAAPWSNAPLRLEVDVLPARPRLLS